MTGWKNSHINNFIPTNFAVGNPTLPLSLFLPTAHMYDSSGASANSKGGNMASELSSSQTVGFSPKYNSYLDN